MRLDKYLKVSRLIKRRSVANDACDNARVTVNGRDAKAGYQVKSYETRPRRVSQSISFSRYFFIPFHELSAKPLLPWCFETLGLMDSVILHAPLTLQLHCNQYTSDFSLSCKTASYR